MKVAQSFTPDPRNLEERRKKMIELKVVIALFFSFTIVYTIVTRSFLIEKIKEFSYNANDFSDGEIESFIRNNELSLLLLTPLSMRGILSKLAEISATYEKGKTSTKQQRIEILRATVQYEQNRFSFFKRRRLEELERKMRQLYKLP